MSSYQQFLFEYTNLFHIKTKFLKCFKQVTSFTGELNVTDELGGILCSHVNTLSDIDEVVFCFKEASISEQGLHAKYSAAANLCANVTK